MLLKVDAILDSHGSPTTFTNQSLRLLGLKGESSLAEKMVVKRALPADKEGDTIHGYQHLNTLDIRLN